MARIKVFDTKTQSWVYADMSFGKDGKSAYEYAKDAGYIGTEAEFAQLLSTGGAADSLILNHNTSVDSHSDIRLLVDGLTTRLNTLADSDDVTLDQMGEIVAYIKSNKSLIDNITTNKVNVDDIINNLTTNTSNKPLSAAQGVVLKELIDAIVIPTKLSQLTNDAGYLTEHQNLDGFATESYVDSKIEAIPIPDVSEQIDAHNTSADAHSDIRALIGEKVYTQPEEPEDAPVGSVWVDTDDDTVENGNSGSKIELDSSLTVEGMAADAKAVGDAISTLSTDIAEAGAIDIDLDESNSGEVNSYLKPQSPLYHKKEDTYFYPLTTVDQVVLEDGSRLNSELSKHLFVDINNTNEAEPNGINADTLGGYAAEEYARKEDLENIDTGVSVDLLWENVNLLDEFAEQNIPLNLSDYYKIEIVLEFCPPMTVNSPNKISNQFISTLHLVSGVGEGNTSYFTTFIGEMEIGRSFIYDKALNFLSIGNCMASTGDMYGNMFLVPYRIYGYKGGNI